MNQDSKPKREFGPFEIEHQLGVGGMGVVYLATYQETGQKMALKILTPHLVADKKLVKRFEREIAILKRLRHPNIIRYFGGGKFKDQPYYAMEVMDGGTFDDILKKRGRLSWEQTVELGRQLCSALEYAHTNGIVHRDLKPANLFLTKKGKVKLGDFGIARDTEATALTAAGKTVGTYAYMAPEQIVGKPPISSKTDLYAMGCVLFQVLTGRTPFEASAPAEMMFHHIEDDPPMVREFAHDCPIWLEKLINRLLEKDGADRPFDALAVMSELEEVKKRVRENVGVTQQTMMGATAVTEQERAELKKALGKTKKRGGKKKKKKKDVPLLERWPILVGGLAIIAGILWYNLQPQPEAERREEIVAAMETQDPDAWREIRPKLDQWLVDFPDHEEAATMLDYVDMIETEVAERQALTRVQFGRSPKSEAERLFVEAFDIEKFGDRVMAIQRYRSIIQLFKSNTEELVFVRLARRHINILEEGGSDALGRLTIINNVLKDAEKLRNTDIVAAQAKWQSIINLYGEYREFARQVEFAKARLKNEKVPDFDFGDDPETEE